MTTNGTALVLHEGERPATALIRPVVEPAAVMALHQAVADMVAQTLKEGVDYGVIPGTKKPSMYKSGSERLCVGFGLVDRYEIVEKEIDHNFENPWEKRDKRGQVYASGTAKGLYRYTVKCYLYRREDNVLVSEGVGACSSLEGKYCDRPRDCENTILKMAKKRAKVDATLTGLGLSDRFTQDVEDMERPVEDAEGQATDRPRGEEVQVEKASRDKLFPMKGPYQGKPIGSMPIDAIEGYLDWIRKKQAEKNDPKFFFDLAEALGEVLAEKIEERDRDQMKLELEGAATDPQSAAPTSTASTQSSGGNSTDTVDVASPRSSATSGSKTTAEAAPKPAVASDVPPCPKCGGRMWDNRVGKRNPNAPDFKCRDRACDGVIWPPKEDAANPQPAASATGTDASTKAAEAAGDDSYNSVHAISKRITELAASEMLDEADRQTIRRDLVACKSNVKQLQALEAKVRKLVDDSLPF